MAAIKAFMYLHFLKANAVSSESRPTPCSIMSRGRLSSSISSFYKYFTPLEQEPIRRFVRLERISARGVRLSVRLNSRRSHETCPTQAGIYRTTTSSKVWSAVGTKQSYFFFSILTNGCALF